MPYSRFIQFVFIFSFAAIPLSAQDLVINEFMSDNESIITDEEGTYPDWIEIYNSGSDAINLKDYHLSDDEDEIDKWSFPEIILQPESFILVFASGKDKHIYNYLHTNFKISRDGEYLVLSDSHGNILDEIPEIALDEDESYGKLPDGGIENVKLPIPTPGSSNNSENKLLFSHPPGFYDAQFELSITSLLGDAVYYTTDGSEPSQESIAYSTPISLKNKTSYPNIWSEIPTSPTQNLISNHAWQAPGKLVDKANVLRIASFKNGQQTSETYTLTYLIDEDAFSKYDMLVISLVTNGPNLFDDETGIYVPGNLYDEEDPEWTGNYFTDERVSERPIHIEIFSPDGELELSQNAGIRIHGGKTRHAAQKSLKLYARKEYGDKFFRYPLMPQNGVEKYERFVLQTSMAAWGGETVIKDILAHEIVRDMNFEKMDYQPAVVYINGEYWGIHHIRDRVDEEYLAYTTGLDIDSLEIERIGNSHFRALTDYFKENLPIDNQDFEYISTQMDMEAFIDYNISEMYLRNYDWPSNNSMHWRPKKPDGKWRWIFFDIDGGFNDAYYNMLVHNTNSDESISWPNDPNATFFFRSLIENELFQEQFLDRYKHLIENDFQTSVTKEKLNEIIEKYKHELPKHSERWHFPRSYDGWLEDIENDLINFLEERPCAVVDNIKAFFDLDEYDVDCEDSTQQVADNGDDNILSIGPNPANKEFFIYNNSIYDLDLEVTIYNSIGALVYRNRIAVYAGQNQPILSDNLTSGIYIVKLQEEKLTKQFTLSISAF